MADWTEKYRPTTLSEVRGNDKAVEALREWAETWDDHGEAAILHGSPGVGKTSAAHALAADLGWASVELNASDDRTADAIQRVAGRASKNSTIAGAIAQAEGGVPGGSTTTAGSGRQLIILDEADNIHYQSDRAGQQALVEIIETATQPLVLVANDLYDMSRGLRNAGRQIEFRDVKRRSILPVLRNICREEDLAYEDDVLAELAERNDGDLRGAVNDLQAAAGGRQRLTLDDIATASRDREQSIWTFLDAVLKEAGAREALYTAFDVDETPDSLVQWVEDKAPMVYEGAELARAYGYLADADKWLGRVRATQNYSYWRYANDNLAAGVAAARDHDRGGWTRYGGPPYRSRSDATRDHVARAIAESAGMSMATARRSVLPFLAAMTHHCQNRELTVAMTAAFDLDAEHVAFVTGSGRDTDKVQSIVADAAARLEAETVEHSAGAFAGEPADDRGLAAFSGDPADEEAAAGEDDEAPAADAVPEDGLHPEDSIADAEEPERAADPEEAAEDESQSDFSQFL